MPRLARPVEICPFDILLSVAERVKREAEEIVYISRNASKALRARQGSNLQKDAYPDDRRSSVEREFKPMSSNIAPGTSRLPQLQTVRGIAALIVAASHPLYYYDTTVEFRFWTEALFNSHAAVIVFFVLSGLVLARSLRSRGLDVNGVSRFITRRIFRILPAIWVALAPMALYVFLIRPEIGTEQVSEWFLRFHDTPPTPWDVVASAAGYGLRILPPLWTIQAELAASFALPLIVWLLHRGKMMGAILLGLLVLLAYATEGSDSYYLTYLVFFAAGAVIPFLKLEYSPSRIWPWIAGISLITLFFARWLSSDWRYEPNYGAITPALIEGAAACLFLSALLKSELLSRALSWQPGVWLGDISYSLYLFHFPVMALLAAGFGALGLSYAPNAMAVVLAICTVIVAVPISYLSYRFVELPGMACGSWLLGYSQARLSNLAARFA